jgi:hypothetical protein
MGQSDCVSAGWHMVITQIRQTSQARISFFSILIDFRIEHTGKISHVSESIALFGDEE